MLVLVLVGRFRCSFDAFAELSVTFRTLIESSIGVGVAFSMDFFVGAVCGVFDQLALVADCAVDVGLLRFEDIHSIAFHAADASHLLAMCASEHVGCDVIRTRHSA